ncbi:MAG: hypothetical protein U0835_11565 [Isosphaeraceae bacterium]
MTRAILSRLVLGLAVLSAPALFLGCAEESKPPEATPSTAPGTPGAGPDPAPKAPGDAPKAEMKPEAPAPAK